MTNLKPEKQTHSQSQTPSSSENPSHSDPNKKTRDLPNLTECHACGLKNDVCTGKNKLRPMYSEWRVVLLCNKCFSCVESSQICSYCFSGKCNDSLHCVKCKHFVHKSCFLKYKNVAPWSYSCVGSESEFSVCVDCWVPKHMENSRRRRLRKIKSRVIEKKGRVGLEKKSSRVLRGGNLMKSMEDAVKEAKNEVKKKIEVAAKARAVAAKRAVVASRAVEFANSALSLVANREDGSLNLPRKIDPVKVVGRSYLNRLPKISKRSRCLLDTSCFNAPKKWTLGVDSSCKTLKKRKASGFDDKLYEDSRKSLCERSVSLGSSVSDSSTDMSCPCSAEYDGEEIGEEVSNEEEGSWSDRLINFGGDCGMELDRKQEDSALHGEKQLGRYFFKYSRRSSDRCPLKYSRKSDRHFFFKYSRRRSDRYYFKYSRRNCLKPNLGS